LFEKITAINYGNPSEGEVELTAKAGCPKYLENNLMKNINTFIYYRKLHVYRGSTQHIASNFQCSLLLRYKQSYGYEES